MNMAAFERAQLVTYASRMARRTGSLDCMKAVCYVLRNRLRAGWGNGSLLQLIEMAPEFAGNELQTTTTLDPQDRLLQLLVRDIDDICLGMSEDDTRTVVQDALYCQFMDRPPRPWFVENIVHKPNEHPRIGQVGPLALFR